MKTGLAAIIIGAVALAILGLVVVLLPGPTASFGWFAFQSAGDFGFVGGALFVPASRLWGLGILAIAAVIGAFVTGWVLGKRRGGRESEMKEPTRTSARVVLRAAEERDQAARQALGWHASIERNYGHEAPDGLMTDDDARDWFAEQVALAEDGADAVSAKLSPPAETATPLVVAKLDRLARSLRDAKDIVEQKQILHRRAIRQRES